MDHQALKQSPQGCVKQRNEDKTDDLTILRMPQQTHLFYVISHNMGYRKSQHHRQRHPSDMLEIQPIEGDEKENVDQREQTPPGHLKKEVPGIRSVGRWHPIEL